MEQSVDSKIPRNAFPPLTPEEIRTLRECNRQAFYNRCVPFSGIGMILVGLGINQGYIKKSFVIGKIMGVGFLGYIVGKMSYIGKCREMILSLPESPLAEKIKKNEQGNYQDMMKEIAVFPTFDDKSRVDRERPALDRNQSSTFDRSSDRYKGLDDSLRPSLDNEMKKSNKPDNFAVLGDPRPLGSGLGVSSGSYDELRNRNRMEYDNARLARPLVPKTSTQPIHTYPTGLQQQQQSASQGILGSPLGNFGSYGDSASEDTRASSKSRDNVHQNRYGDVVME